MYMLIHKLYVCSYQLLPVTAVFLFKYCIYYYSVDYKARTLYYALPFYINMEVYLLYVEVKNEKCLCQNPYNKLFCTCASFRYC